MQSGSLIRKIRSWSAVPFHIAERSIKRVFEILLTTIRVLLSTLQTTFEEQTGISLSHLRASVSYWVLSLLTWGTVAGTIAIASTIVLIIVSPLQTWFVYSTVLGLGELSETHVHQRVPVYFVWHHFNFEKSADSTGHLKNVDLHLPHASVRLIPLGRAAQSLSYTLSLILTLPESAVNLDIGTFTIRLDIFDASGTLLDQIHRSAILRYKSSLVQRLQSIIHGIPLLLGLGSRFEEKQVVTIRFLENYRFDEEFSAFEWLNLTISHPKIQIYDAELHLDAQLSGLRYYFYHWFWTTFVLVTIAIFWLDMTVLFIFTLGLTIRQWWRRTQHKPTEESESTNEKERDLNEKEQERDLDRISISSLPHKEKLRFEREKRSRIHSSSSSSEVDDSGAGVLSMLRMEDLLSSDSNGSESMQSTEQSRITLSSQSPTLRQRQKSDL